MNSPVSTPVTTHPPVARPAVPSGAAATAGSAAAFAAGLEVIAAAEPQVAAAIAGELASQRRQLKLIASENYASPAVLLAMGNWLSDKYAEGTAGRRLYAGCEMVDQVEELAAGHARALFGAEHAYVQPHSGIDANLVAFWSILARRVEEPALRAAGVRHVNDLATADWDRLRDQLHGQRMLGMALDAGGHLQQARSARPWWRRWWAGITATSAERSAVVAPLMGRRWWRRWWGARAGRDGRG